MAERILLVEDEEKLARMVELELQYEGYEVEKAFDGRAGLDRALSGEFDLVLLDIKHIDPQEHVRLCGQPQENILAFARYLEQKRIPVWIRHVVVPGITDSETYLYRLGQYLGTLKNIKALDVLPYHDMGKAKYKSLGITYPLEGTEPLPPDRAAAARQVILRGMRDSRNCS